MPAGDHNWPPLTIDSIYGTAPVIGDVGLSLQQELIDLRKRVELLERILNDPELIVKHRLRETDGD